MAQHYIYTVKTHLNGHVTIYPRYGLEGHCFISIGPFKIIFPKRAFTKNLLFDSNFFPELVFFYLLLTK